MTTAPTKEVETMKYEIYTSRNESIFVKNIHDLHSACCMERAKGNKIVCIWNVKTGENMNDRFENEIG